ncbi:oligoendopeptidase F [Ammoniphilus resinae]|uniref:Oligopeptidase F n=1 Tax=Ammoniphilus resinae TaxID=861532 RepID=A0ABS4GWM2_9BACL|nr:oligoendopeptidase F [Ammoniphilus resinae]MBP1934663.1 oligoendopeptidase F [Ammoniphilus resinae]
MQNKGKIFMMLLVSICLTTFITTSGFGKENGEAKRPHYESRGQIPEQYKWQMKDLYEDKKTWEEDIRKVEKLAAQLGNQAGKLGQGAEHLKKSLEIYTALNRTFEKVYAYAKLSLDTNKSNPDYQAMSNQVDDLSMKVGEKISFFIPELLQIPGEKLQQFMKQPEMEKYQRWISVQIRDREHTLPKEMEQVLAKSSSIANAPESIFGMLTKDMIYPTIKDETGKEVKLTPANYGSYIKSNNREVRKKAYDAYYKTVDQFKDTFAQILQSEVKKNIFYSDVRKYPSSLDASLEANNIPSSVYDNLISTIHKQLPLLHQYITLKKEAAGLKEMHLYDLYRGFNQTENTTYIPYDKATEMVKNGLAVLGEEYSQLLGRAFQERWMDVYYTKGKRTGAYQWGAYDSHPYILLNYQGDMDDIFTIAHELGHAGHSYFSNRSQDYLYASYPIFTAEVASTTNEALLFREMYRQAKTKEEKISILNQRLEDYMGTLFLQTMFAEFEKAIHVKAEQGEALTADTLSTIYGDLMRKYYGESLLVDHFASLGWARIPHFYRNYYVYQYATGFAAANAFAQRIIDDGEPAVNDYIKKFLSAGDSKDPIEVLKDAGIDMTSPRVVKQALKGFEETLKELQALLNT